MTNFIYEDDLSIQGVEKIRNSLIDNTLAVDTEAMGLINRRDRLCVVQLSAGDDNAHIVRFTKTDNYTAARNLASVLFDDNITKVFHFARFDVAILKFYLQDWAYPCYCTKIASRLARTYTNNHSLKELCSELLNVKLNKQQQLSDWGAEQLTPEQIHYAAADVIYLHKIKQKLDIIVKRENRKYLLKECCEFLRTRIELDLLGWNYDIFSHSIVHNN